MRTALHGRVERLEAKARQATVPTIGSVVAAILSRRKPGPPITDEELAKSAAGRLLVERQRRAEAGYPG
jgi:hypothetical protein